MTAQGFAEAQASFAAALAEGDALPSLSALRAAFDAAYYLRENGDVQAAGLDPLMHYLAQGCIEGRNPRPDFHTRFYAAAQNVLPEDAFLHWVRRGRPAGGDTVPPGIDGVDPADLPALRAAFDTRYYLSENADVAASGDDALLHYLRLGWREGRNPRADFNTAHYAATHAPAPHHPFAHWVMAGRRLGLSTVPPELPGVPAGSLPALRAAFDDAFYLSRHADVVACRADPFVHFMTIGWREGRDPRPDFGTRFYLRANPDIAGWSENPFVHWVLHGRAEGRVARDPASWSGAAAYARDALGLSAVQTARVSAAFDDAFYRRANPGLDHDRMPPLLHYLALGWREGRNPAPGFDARFYLEANPDIAAGGIDPFLHWVLHGRAEGRPTRALPDPCVTPDRADHDPADLAAIAPLVDAGFYLARHDTGGIDPALHYLMLGWRLGHDPAPWFSTRFYLERHPDLRASGGNPLVHYARHGRAERRETKAYTDLRGPAFRPRVSVIVPNYNHAAYLPQRLQSIADQGYPDLELIILDDCSSDDSHAVIADEVARLEIEARLVFNDVNAGNVFAQWEKGISLATGDLVWICESDDFCDSDFLARIVPAFVDEAVTLAFGRIQFANGDGIPREGLDAYRETAEPGIWNAPLSRPAAEWVAGALGVRNVIANVGGCVFRRQSLPRDVWDRARGFRVCGDWFLYLHLAGAGKIAFVPDAVAHFRQHDRNTSSGSFGERVYYDEHLRILGEIVRLWAPPAETRARFLHEVAAQYDRCGMAARLGPFADVFDTGALMAAPRQARHVLIPFLGFHVGGGEMLPIALANALRAQGWLVSMLALDFAGESADMRARLEPGIPVYQALDMARAGRGAFFDAAGVDVVNTHVAGADAFLFSLGRAPMERPWVVTLHGSYAGFGTAPAPMIEWIIANVDRWVHVADRNLDFFEGRSGVERARFVKLPNAMPPDPRPTPVTRADLGIGEGDCVFMLVGRAIARKGWVTAVRAFGDLVRRTGREDLHLIMVGDGEMRARAEAEGVQGVHFLGFQSAVNGLLRMADALVLPSRFAGESFPLCLIQALQEGVPAIATDIGEVRAMLTAANGAAAGLVLPFDEDDAAFTAALSRAMDQMADPALRRALAPAVTEVAARYDMGRLAERYGRIFRAAGQAAGGFTTCRQGCAAPAPGPHAPLRQPLRLFLPAG